MTERPIDKPEKRVKPEPEGPILPHEPSMERSPKKPVPDKPPAPANIGEDAGNI